jgi:hypothetical protein
MLSNFVKSFVKLLLDQAQQQAKLRESAKKTGPPTEAAFYRLKRAKYLVCNNMYDATLKIIAVAKLRANIVVHICSSIAWQAGARPSLSHRRLGYPRLVGRGRSR